MVPRVETADLSLGHLTGLILHWSHLALILALAQKVSMARDVKLGEQRGGEQQQTPHPQLIFSGGCSQLDFPAYLPDLYGPGVRKEGREQNGKG